MGSYIDTKLYPNTYTKLGSAIDLDSEVNGVLTVVNGGTGSPTASAARVNLGVGIGTDVQKYDQI